MKKIVSFQRDDLKLVGNLFTPNTFDENGHYDAIIVEGSFTSVKEQMAQTYAEKFSDAGFVVLAFDYSHYGESEGLSRQFESPAEKLSDLKAAVTFLADLPYIDTVSMVGVCTSAGNAAYLAADDSRIKTLATVAGMLPDPALFKRLNGEDGIAARLKEAAEARTRFNTTGEVTIIPAYSETEQNAANYIPVEGVFDYYLNESRGNVPTYKNELDATSWDGWLAFDPIKQASSITTPTMVIHSDDCAFPDQARKFHDALQGPKDLVWADGNHYDYYDSPAQIDSAVAKIVRFVNQHVDEQVRQKLG